LRALQIDCRYCRYCRYCNIRTEPASRARTIILQVSSGQVSDRIFPPRLACEFAICQPGPGCAISESSRRGGLCALVTERYTVHIMRAICIYTVTAIQPSFARSLSFFSSHGPKLFSGWARIAGARVDPTFLFYLSGELGLACV
jgi:hypothetical protein